MKTTCRWMTIGCLLLLVSMPAARGQWEASKEGLVNAAEREEEFMDWGLGMFIHWSLDSQLGSVISHSMVGANEKYLDRFINDLPKTFNPKRYDPDEWMDIAQLAGVKYMVLTTKHHSGFCLWDSKTTDFDIMNTPYKKDIVREYVDACRKRGLKVGFYFSPEDFYFLHQQGHVVRRSGDHSRISKNQELLDYDKQQMKELLTNYGPIDVVFLDAFDNAQIRDYVHELQPNCLVTRGEMATPEQKIPDAPIPGPWESCFTLGTQWQFKPTNEEYKSGGKLIEMLIETRAKGGNLLINVGPEPSGIIPFEQERVFRELALWMFINDEAIHNVRPCKVVGEDNVWYTQSKDGKCVYVFMTEFTGKDRWKHGERKNIVLKNWKATDQSKVSVLGQNDKVLEYNPKADPTSRVKQTDAGIELSIMRAQRIYNNKAWPNTVVLKLENVEFVGNTD
ncbi:Alpha-L-fucosidase [Novipirellula aureliae]|uniref:alpha-L-fucosidase n=1 Tax=Novipirellula aureliae TaxID=2527966 RepID=A0A5C6DVP5_9BACT|nr:alpha-L-fucosidase [Novipirellula aureliae]TWU38879.1 Alpha-L-fucosidase [Novipirellula aureliae]